MTQPPIRVLCVDDHAFLGEGLKARLDVEPDMEFVGYLSTAGNLAGHARRTRADVVLLDIEMPGEDAFEQMAELNRLSPHVRTILLSAHVRDHYIDAAYQAGAWGYISKSDSPDAVIDGIRKVHSGEPAFGAEVMARTQPAKPAVSGGSRTAAAGSKRRLLTSREEQILRMIAGGMSRTTIAEVLCRSPMTIDNHRKSIMKKLGIHDRVELARYAIAEGFGEV
ncbi:MAG: response regulator transcription factor [Planctomycetes bacterium]|nr:response regulator transcription factor [Planctomycetota bacterium]